MISLTESAVEKIRAGLTTHGPDAGIYLGTKITGCAGLAYVLEYLEATPDLSEHMQYQIHGIKIWIKHVDLKYLDGITMNWVREGLNERMVFENPNAASACGCGESFTVVSLS
jgi:iron-sulfur cluster assembly protein